jgi:hypothetical protein
MLDKHLHEMIERLGRNLRAASTCSERRELIQTSNMLISRPVSSEEKGGPELIDLQEYARSGKAAAASVQGINKVKVIHDFFSRGY